MTTTPPAHPDRATTPIRPRSEGAMPLEQLTVQTEDGLQLALYRLAYPGAFGPPVLLVHGLSACRHAFTMPRRSLAQYLAARGFDCFVAELRGAGDSDNPQWRWDMHDHIEYDLPALLQRIQELTGHERVHTIGHSMGGILLLGLGIENPQSPLASVLAVASSLDYSVGRSIFAQATRLLPALSGLSVLPSARLFAALSHLVGRLPLPHEHIHVNPQNIEPQMLRQLYRLCLGDLAVPLLKSLAATFEPEGFCNRRGSVRYVERAQQIRFPVALFAGNRDLQAPLASIEHTAQRIPGAELRRFGAPYGHRADYGHYDLILGRRAAEEVWPEIVQWLRGQALVPAPGFGRQQVP